MTTNAQLCLVPTIGTTSIFLKNTHKKVFYKENDALLYLSEHHDENLYIFSEDISAKSQKRFYTLHSDIIFELSQMKKFHLYENFGKDQKVKMMLDIDLKKSQLKDESTGDQYFKSVIDSSIGMISSKLKSYGIKNIQVIILTANRKDKYSSHIIFPNVYFENIYKMKFFMMDISSPLINDNIIDLAIYRKGCFRMLWNSKCGKGNNLEFSEGINYNYSSKNGNGNENDKQLFMDCLVTNIPATAQLVDFKIDENIKLNKQKKGFPIKLKSVNFQQRTNKKISVDVLKKYVDLLSIKRTKKYGDWLEIGMCLYNCNNTEKCFDLWTTWSKQCSEAYDHNVCIYKWNSFSRQSEQSGYSIGTLKFLAKKDNSEEYDKLEFSLEKLWFSSIKFERNFLLDKKSKEKIKDEKSIVTQKVTEWINTKNTKSLAIRSGYNTGKTSFVTQLVEEFGFEKILMISYRISLTNDLCGSFVNLNFVSYMNHMYREDRMVCQVESLNKLLLPNYLTSEITIPSYDLVVLDEVEGILSHFNSTTIKNKEKTFELFNSFLFNANKILMLDGDFGNRSYDLLKEHGDYIILENTKKKGDKRFIFTSDGELFNNNVDDALSKKLNIVIVCMSSKIAQAYYKKYSMIYKTILHCSNSDDALKESLKNVTELWKNYQLIIYTPTIEAGVNFDIEHVDKMFVVLSSKSCSPRALLQMCARIRQIKDKNIYVNLNKMPFKTKASFYKYDEVKDYVCDMYQKYLPCELVLDELTKKEILKCKYDLYAKILIHNETEVYNKSAYYFVPYLINLLTGKGNTYEFIKKEKSVKKVDKTQKDNSGSVIQDEIVMAKDINQHEYEYLILKQKSGNATHQDKIQLEKYMYETQWGTKEITTEFMNKFYGKTPVLNNLRYITGKLKLTPKNETTDDNIDFFNIEMIEKIKMINELLSTLGYKCVTDDSKITKEIFDKNYQMALTKVEIFTHPEKTSTLFQLPKHKIHSIKSFLGFVNSCIFKEFGFEIKTTFKNFKKNNRQYTMYSYEIQFDNLINIYI